MRYGIDTGLKNASGVIERPDFIAAYLISETA